MKKNATFFICSVIILNIVEGSVQINATNMSKIIEEKNNNDFKTVYLDINEYNNIIEYTNLTNLFYIDLQLDTTRVNKTFII